MDSPLKILCFACEHALVPTETRVRRGTKLVSTYRPSYHATYVSSDRNDAMIRAHFRKKRMGFGKRNNLRVLSLDVGWKT